MVSYMVSAKEVFTRVTNIIFLKKICLLDKSRNIARPDPAERENTLKIGHYIIWHLAEELQNCEKYKVIKNHL